MGQKANPTSLRLGVNRTWDSRWYADDNYAGYLHEDVKIKEFLKEKLAQAGISKIVIERPAKKARVTIHSASPGVVIGKKGQDIEALRKEIQALTSSEVQLNILEVRKPELDAQLVADSVAQQLERRVAFRRAMKMSIRNAMRLGAKGIKINCSGRLGGAEIARAEHYHEGTIPLQTLRADIEYGFAEANTTYGKIGIKVWIYKGEILNEVNRPGSAPRRNDRRNDNRGDRRDNRRNDRGNRNGGERRDNRGFRGERKERTPREGGAK